MIRPATSFDIPRALTIYHSARQFMRRSGNTANERRRLVGLLRMRSQIRQINFVQRIALRLNAHNHAVIRRGARDNVQIDACREHIAVLMVCVIAAQFGSARCAEQLDFFRSAKLCAEMIQNMKKAVFIIRERIAAGAAAINTTNCIV